MRMFPPRRWYLLNDVMDAAPESLVTWIVNTTLYILELMPFEGGKLLGCFCRSHIQFCEKCLKSRSSFYSPSEKKETGAKKLRQQLTLWRAITIWSSFTMYQSNEGKGEELWHNHVKYILDFNCYFESLTDFGFNFFELRASVLARSNHHCRH